MKKENDASTVDFVLYASPLLQTAVETDKTSRLTSVKTDEHRSKHFVFLVSKSFSHDASIRCK
jgi:hypothetical protein